MALSLHWSTLPIILYLLGVYTVPFALVVSLLVFGVPALRRRRAARVAAWVSLAAGASCPIGAALFFVEDVAFMGAQSMSVVRRTHHLTQPETFFGTIYPAGSTVLVAESGNAVESGTLSQPTLLRGLPLVGAFSLSPASSDTPAGASGTLATDAVINTAPCAGHRAVSYNPTFISCTLAHDLLRDGFHLAGGTFLILRRKPASNDFALEQGAFAEPTLLFGTTYPAQTILSPGYWSLAPNAPSLAVQYAALPGPEQTGIQTLCLTSGTTVKLEGAVLHGALQIGYMPDRIDVTAGCNYQLSEDDKIAERESGYATRGDQRFMAGRAQPSTHTWPTMQRTMTGN